MCGIIGIIGNREVAPMLVDGLKRLEYRGYDSAGIATLVKGGIERRRDGDLPSPHRHGALAPNGHDLEITARFRDGAGSVTDGVGIQRSRQSTVGREQHDQARPLPARGE